MSLEFDMKTKGPDSSRGQLPNFSYCYLHAGIGIAQGPTP